MPRKRLPKFVTIQVEGLLPRPNKLDPSKLTKKREWRWVTVCRASLLYADRQVVLVRQFGCESMYYPTGSNRFASWSREHPSAKNIPQSHGRWRLHPDSVRAIQGGVR